MDLIAAARAQAKGSGTRSTWAVIPPETIPGYEIIKEIHRGGQGVVYQAIQKATTRKVAIKVMREGPFAGPRDRARFEREVEILAQLNHPNIVGILDSGQAGAPGGGASGSAGGSFYFVMDYISGHPLDQWMSLEPRSLDDTLKIFARICDAVNAAHLKGVIHRDLKPGNIRVDARGEPHVLDFGLAKIATGEVSGGEDRGGPRMMTMTGQFVGSLPWASPEQAEGHPDKVDVRTDVYSLGVILYQMLTGGKFPYEVVGTMREVLDNILRAQPQRPSTIRRQINDEVETIVLKTLSKERDRRYQNAGELARDVRNYLGGFPIEAKRDSAVYQLRVMARRNKGVVGFVSAVAILTAAYGVTMSMLYRSEQSARAAAVQLQQAAEEARKAADEQRLLAEENFNSVRALARTFMFDFDEGIAKLRGATKTRERLLTEARDYLEKLAARAGDNPELLREVADASDKVGDIEGGLHMPKIGTPGAAQAAYARARTIREGLLARFPDDARSHADMATSHRKTAAMLSQARQFVEAKEQSEKSLAAYEKAISLSAAGGPEIRRLQDARAKARVQLGDLVARIAQDINDIDTRERAESQANALYDDAAIYWNERHNASPDEIEPARWLGICRDKRIGLSGNIAVLLARRVDEFGKKGDKEGARESFKKAQARYAAALALAGKSVDEFGTLIEKQPQNAELRRDLWLATSWIGWAHKGIGQLNVLAAGSSEDPAATRAAAQSSFAQSLEAYQRALQITEELARADPANIEAQRDLAVSLMEVGNQLRDLQRLEEAAAVIDRSLAIRRDMLTSDPLMQHTQDLALGLFKRAQMDQRLAEASKEPSERKLRFEAAERGFTEALDRFNAMVDQNVKAKDARDIVVTKAALDAVIKAKSEAPQPPPSP